VALKATGVHKNPQRDAARLHGATTENIFGVRSVWCAKDKTATTSTFIPSVHYAAFKALR
jgi:hypothetical protein